MLKNTESMQKNLSYIALDKLAFYNEIIPYSLSSTILTEKYLRSLLSIVKSYMLHA